MVDNSADNSCGVTKKAKNDKVQSFGKGYGKVALF